MIETIYPKAKTQNSGNGFGNHHFFRFHVRVSDCISSFYVKTYLDSRDHCISNRLFSKKSQRILGGLLAAWHFLLPGGIKKDLPVLVKGGLDQSV